MIDIEYADGRRESFPAGWTSEKPQGFDRAVAIKTPAGNLLSIWFTDIQSITVYRDNGQVDWSMGERNEHD